MSDARRPRLTHLLVAAALAIAAFILVLAATDLPGPGLDPDAMAYMGAAESVAARGEYRVPSAPWWSADSTAALAHFPPAFPTVLALPVRLGMAPPQAARLVEALAAAVTVLTVVLLVSEAATLLAGGLLAVALFAMAAMHEVHVSVLSEPLFLACTALTVAAMTRRRRRPLVVGVIAAAGVLTRYAGLALVGAAAIAAYVEPGSLRERARRLVLTLLPTVVLQGAWIARTQLLGGPATIRQFALYGGFGTTLDQGGRTLRDWIVPDPGAPENAMPGRALLAAMAILVLITLVAMGARRIAVARTTASGAARIRDEAAARLLAACALIGGCYLAVLVVSRLLADPAIPFDARILSPFLLLASVAVAVSLAAWWRPPDAAAARRGHGLARAAVAGALGVWLVASAAVTRGQWRQALAWGSDFAGEQWRDSELLLWARLDGARVPLFSNGPSAVWFHLHRPARAVPRRADAAALAAFADTLRVRGGRVLAFDVSDPGYATRTALERAPGLRVVEQLSDGVILEAAPVQRSTTAMPVPPPAILVHPRP